MASYYQPDWVSGTITLTSGSTAFTVAGADLVAIGVQPGDEIYSTTTGSGLLIDSVTDSTHGVLAYDCPSDLAGSALPLRIRFQPDGSRFAAAYLNVLQKFKGGNLDALAGLTGAAGKMGYFTGAGTMDLTALTAAARTFLAGGTLTIESGNIVLSPAATTDAFITVPSTSNKKITFAVAGGASLANVTFQSDLVSVSGTMNVSGQVSGGGVTTGTSDLTLGRTDQADGYVLRPNIATANMVFCKVGGSPLAAFTVAAAGAAFTGTLTAATKNFVIDHPLDPANKTLVHAAYEGAKHGLLYHGTVELVAGKATIDLDAANGLSAGTIAATAQTIVVSSLQNQTGFARVKPGPVSGASFDVICEDDTCTDTIAWVVLAERADPFVKQLAAYSDRTTGKLIPEIEKEAA